MRKLRGITALLCIAILGRLEFLGSMSLDSTFGTSGKTTTHMGGTDSARDGVMQWDRKIIVAGGNGSNFALARYTTAGILDTTFGASGITTTDIGGTDVAYATAVQSDGKIVAVGTTGGDFGIVRYNSNGSLDNTFGSGGRVTLNQSGIDVLYGIALQSDGKIVAVGTNGSVFIIARYTTAGVLDTTFDSDGVVWTDMGGADVAYSVAIQPADGKIVVAGTNGSDFAVARYNSNGSLDTTFNTTGKVTTDMGGTDIAYSVALQSDGKIVVAGTNGSNFAVARYNSNGSLDTTFDGDGKVTTDMGGTDIAYSIKIQSGNKILVAGTNGSDFALAQYDIFGILDPTFGSGGKVTTDMGGVDIAYGMALQADGSIVVAGTNGLDFALARYTIGGVLDTTFDTDGKVTTNFPSTDIAYGVALQSDGKFVVVGTNGFDFVVARYLPTGILDTTFGNQGITTTDFGGTDIAYAVALQSDGKIVVAGASGSNFAVARYTTDGFLDGSFGTAGKTTLGDGSFNSVAIQSDGKIVLAGTNSVARFVIVRYNTNGTLDTAFDGDGIIWTNPGSPAVAYAIAIQTDGKIVAAGTNGSDFAVARYNTNGSLDTSFDTDGILTTDFSGTDIAYSVAIQPDGKIVVGGRNATDFAIARYTTAGALDTTFDGDGKGTIDFGGATDIAYKIIPQQDGKMIAVGTNSSDFALARWTSHSSGMGTLDTTYQTNGFLPFPASSSAAYNSSVKALQVQSDSSVYVVSEDYATTLRCRLVKLSSTGATSLSPITITQLGASDLITDGSGRVLVCGTDGNGWLRRYTTSGSLAADATFGTSGLINASSTSSSFKKIGEQKSGRIIVLGQAATSTTGALFAYDQTGDVMPSFGTNGVYSIANTTIDDMVIGSDDGVYIVYKGATNLEIRKVKHDGSGLAAGYNSGAAINTGLAHASHTQGCLALDSSGRILFVTVHTSTGNILVRRYTTAGVLLNSLTIAQTTHLLTASTVITSLQCDVFNRPVLVGYDTNVCFVMLLSSFINGFNTEFNQVSDWYKNPFLVPGILKFMYNSDYPSDSTSPKRKLHCLGIYPNGTLIAGGHEAITSTTSTSFIAKIRATIGSQAARYPGESLGTVNANFGSGGELSLSSLESSGEVKALTVLSNGKIVAAIDTGAATSVVRLESDYTTDTTFGSGTGKIALSGFANPSNILSDVVGDVYVVGDNGSGVSRLQKVAADGSAVQWTASTNVVVGNKIAQQSTNTMVLFGQDGSGGVIAFYDGDTGLLQTSLGVNGYYQTGVTSQISDGFVRSDDTIVFAYRDGSGNAIVQRLLADGSAVDSNFTFGSALNPVSADNQIKIAQDVNGKIIVVARNGSGNFIVRRYAANGANDGSAVTITLTNPTTSSLRNIITLSDGSTLILGSNSNGSTLICAKLTAALALDTAFGTSGLSQLSLTTMRTFYALGVTADMGIIVGGGSVTPVPYMTSLYNSDVVTAVDQDVSLLSIGVLDSSFYDGALNLSSFDGSLADCAPASIVSISDGSSFICLDNGSTLSKLIKVTSAGELDTSYHTTGIATNGPAGAYKIMVDGFDRVVMIGNDADGGWIHRYTTGGDADITFGSGGTAYGNLDAIYSIAELSFGRYIVGGALGGVGVIQAYTSNGDLDTLFNETGQFSSGLSNGIYTVIADEYDRIYYAIKNGSAVDLVRLTSYGSLDTSWSSDGILAGAIPADVDSASQIRLAFDVSGNIVVAAHGNNGSDGIFVRAYDATGSAVNGFSPVTLSSFTSPVLTDMIGTSDGNLLISGYQSGDNPMWIARVTSTGSLDTTFGDGDGIATFSIAGTAQTARVLQGIASHSRSKIIGIGYELVSNLKSPYLFQVTNNIILSQTDQCTGFTGVGSNDTTLGLTGTNGVSFYASQGATGSQQQIAQALIVQDSQKFVVAIDGQSIANTESRIFLNRFLMNGLVDTTFGTDGQVEIPHTYQHEYVRDVYHFTVAGVHKILLTGYATSTGLSQSGSLLVLYDLTNEAVDSSFGGYENHPTGMVFGYGQKGYGVGMQSNGRILVCGMGKDNLDLITAYTPAGKVDTSFGQQGYFTQGTQPLYTSVIDGDNKVVIAYNDSDTVAVARILADGSGVDTTFGVNGFVEEKITPIAGNSNMKLALDIDGLIIAAAVLDNGTDIMIKRYDVDGTLDQSLTILGSTVGNITNFTLSAVLPDVDGKITLLGYTTSALMVLRLTADLSGLDTDFSTNGYHLYTIGAGSSQVYKDALMSDDGRIMTAGYQE